MYTAAPATLIDVQLTRNRAVVTGGSSVTSAQAGGGGLYSLGPSLNLTGCTLTANAAAQSGGAASSIHLAIGGGVALNATCQLTTSGALSTFRDNQVSSHFMPLGGAVYVGRAAASYLFSALVEPYTGAWSSGVAINTVYKEASGIVTQPSLAPTFSPTTAPTTAPTTRPTTVPTTLPTRGPTTEPTLHPTTFPTAMPVSLVSRHSTRDARAGVTSRVVCTNWPISNRGMLCSILQENVSVPLVIEVAGAAYGPQSGLLLNPRGEMQLYGSSSRPGTYSWTSDNGTSCMVPAGPYLVVPAGCLLPDSRYTFTLRLTQDSGQWTVRQARRVESGLACRLCALMYCHCC